MRFTPLFACNSLNLLNLRIAVRSSGCRHCGCVESVIAHGHLKGYAPSGHDIVTRGLRFFCSNRHSNIGCGRTFPIYWENVIPFASLRTAQLVDFIGTLASAASPHAAWCASSLPMSLSSAYRWWHKWKRPGSRLLTWLGTLVDPPLKTDGLPDPLHLRHLHAAFPACPCPGTAFQNHFQIPVCS